MSRPALRLIVFAALAGVLLPWSLPSAQEDPTCADDTPRKDDSRYLRSLSLDLRGTIPSVEELQELKSGKTHEAFIDTWLAEPAFLDRAVMLHRDLLWNNVEETDLIGSTSSLQFAPAEEPENSVSVCASGSSASTCTQRNYVRNNARGYRGEPVPCLDEPAQFDSEGNIITTLQADGTHREGWVLVRPYYYPPIMDPRDPPPEEQLAWLPEEIKVCAFDAQENLYSPTGVRCGTRQGTMEPGCGCGPNLRWCSRGAVGERPTAIAFSDDVDLRIKAVLEDDRSYLDLFFDNTAQVNGPIAHFLRWQTEIINDIYFEPTPYPIESVPEGLHYNDYDDWQPVALGTEHAGILTSPAYLMRFQTRRARANRFFNAFLCQPLQPPGDGLPVSDESDAYTLDLQNRDGCRDCHAILEPSGAYWGRWPERSVGYLSPAEFPDFDAACAHCAETSVGCSDACARYYVTNLVSSESDDYAGMLQALEFRLPEHIDNLLLGPRRLAASAVADGRLPDCVSQTAATWLLGREPTDEEKPWIDELSADFVHSGFSYRSLIRDILTSPVYRSQQ